MSGVTSDGLMITALPAMSAMSAGTALSRNGKFQGPITPITPRGE